MLIKPNSKVVRRVRVTPNSVKFKKVFDLVKDINKSFGYKRFTGVGINRVYYIVGCGILIEFQDAEKSMSVVSNINGKVLSCRLALKGMESLNILNNYKCSMTPNCLVLE